MSNNFLNNGFSSHLNKSFGMNIIPERTIIQIKDSALNLVKDVVRPITGIGEGKEDVLNGTIGEKIAIYNRIANEVITTMAAGDDKNHRTLDIKL